MVQNFSRFPRSLSFYWITLLLIRRCSQLKLILASEKILPCLFSEVYICIAIAIQRHFWSVLCLRVLLFLRQMILFVAVSEWVDGLILVTFFEGLNMKFNQLLSNFSQIFNSRKAIAEAIIGLLLNFCTTRRRVLVFYCSFLTIQRNWIVLERCLFYDLKRSISVASFSSVVFWSVFKTGGKSQCCTWKQSV